jgi:hypothetical protein
MVGIGVLWYERIIITSNGGKKHVGVMKRCVGGFSGVRFLVQSIFIILDFHGEFDTLKDA